MSNLENFLALQAAYDALEVRLETLEKAPARLDRALALLREVEKRRTRFPGPCLFCGVLSAPHGPGHHSDCKLDALLEESDAQ